MNRRRSFEGREYTVGLAKTRKRRRLTSAREIDGDPVGRDALVRSTPTWRGPNKLRGEHGIVVGSAFGWEREGEKRDDYSLVLKEKERETEEVKEGNQARRRREGHAP